MGEFLKTITALKSAKLTDYKAIHVVMGNESCDLDSTVSTIVLAYLIHLKNILSGKKSLVIPVLNVPANLFHLRTETCHVLNECGIKFNQLYYRDQMNFKDLMASHQMESTLVDHHVLAERDKVLERTVVAVYDHRPINTQEIIRNGDVQQCIEPVGSCCTLISKVAFDFNDPSILCLDLCGLLYAGIVFDTIGLDKKFGRTTDKDIQIAERLESVLNFSADCRKTLFDKLWTVHNDISHLSTADLLHRDLKIVKGIPIPGLPLLVEKYLKLAKADDAVQTFAREFNACCVVLIGIDARQDVKRDIGIYFTDDRLKNTLVEILKNAKDSAGLGLQLTEIPTEYENIICFTQGNIKLTRKFILPLVNEAVATK